MDEPIASLVDFARRARDEDWLRESRVIGIEFSHSLYLSPAFEELSFRLSGNTVSFEIEWRGTGQYLGDLYRDLWALVGEIAEECQFVALTEESDGISAQVVCGSESHGHSLSMRIVGKAVAGALAAAEEVRRGRMRGRPT